MANFKFTQDIKNYILFKAGEKTDGTSDFDTKAIEYINAAYRKIWSGGGEFDVDINEDWLWLRTRSTFTLLPKITTGTVSVTNNSTTATLSASQALDVDDYYFKIDGHEDVFRIATHTAATTGLVLDSVYTGTTDTSANYTLYKLDYTFETDTIDILSPMTTSRSNDNHGRIEGLTLDKMVPLVRMRSGIPNKFAYIDDNTVRFDRYMDTDLLRVDYWYKKRPADLTDSGSEEPEIPLRHRHILGNVALWDLLLDINDDRAETVGLSAKNGLLAMSRENQARIAMIGGRYGQILPRWDLDTVERFNREPYQS